MPLERGPARTHRVERQQVGRSQRGVAVELAVEGIRFAGAAHVHKYDGACATNRGEQPGVEVRHRHGRLSGTTLERHQRIGVPCRTGRLEHDDVQREGASGIVAILRDGDAATAGRPRDARDVTVEQYASRRNRRRPTSAQRGDQQAASVTAPQNLPRPIDLARRRIVRRSVSRRHLPTVRPPEPTLGGAHQHPDDHDGDRADDVVPEEGDRGERRRPRRRIPCRRSVR